MPERISSDVGCLVSRPTVGVDRRHAIAEPRLAVDNIVHFRGAVPLKPVSHGHCIYYQISFAVRRISRAAIEVDVEGVVVARSDGRCDAGRLRETESGFKTDINSIVEVVVCTEEKIEI